MLKNNKGYSIIELLAVILITSVVLIPLMQGFIQSIENNYRQQEKRNAASMAEGTLNAFDKLTFSNINTLLDDNKLNNNLYFYEFNADNCAIFDAPTDDTLCLEIFNAIYNNFQADSTQFRVFVYESNLSTLEKDDLTNRGTSTLPEQVMKEIDNIPTTLEPSIDLLNVTVWIQYNTDPDLYIVVTGKIDDLD